MSSFLKYIYINVKESNEEFIRNITLLKNTSEIELSQPITYFVWENGSGKSTLLEAIASNFWLNKEWWNKHHNFSTNQTEKSEDNWIKLSWVPIKFKYWYFFRAESIYNTINYLETVQWWFSPYWWENLHKNSHWEQFLKIFEAQKEIPWFYIIDEIESALSPANQLKVREIIKYMAKNGSQFIIATHSPIILSIKENSQIFTLDFWKIMETEYDMTSCVDIYKRILFPKK